MLYYCFWQVFIFYGPRSNSDFFVHSGFYYEGNEHDRLHVKLGEFVTRIFETVSHWLKKNAEESNSKLLSCVGIFRNQFK